MQGTDPLEFEFQRAGRPFPGDLETISKTVAARIGEVYNRKAGIIYAPVDTDCFTPGVPSGDFFLIVAALRLFLEREPEFDPRAIREHVRSFGREFFKEKFRSAVEDAAAGRPGASDPGQKVFA